MNFKSFLLGAAAASILWTGASFAGASVFTNEQKKEIGTIVRDYLMANPQVLFEVAAKKQEQDEEKASQGAKIVLKEKHDQLFNNPEYAVLGNPKAAVAFVEFFDYNCGYCKHALPDLIKLTDANKDIRIVLVDTPILGPTSLDAARFAVASKTFGKYIDYHKALMNFTGPKSEENLMKLARDVGLDADKLKEQAGKPETMDQISKNMDLFQALGLSGTPGFAAPDRVLRGMVGEEVMTQVAKEIMAGK